MINFERKGNRIVVDIETSTGIRVLPEINCSDELYASLLRKDISAKLWDTIVAIRAEAYQQGWSDKSKKVKKQTWFNGNFKK